MPFQEVKSEQEMGIPISWLIVLYRAAMNNHNPGGVPEDFIYYFALISKSFFKKYSSKMDSIWSTCESKAKFWPRIFMWTSHHRVRWSNFLWWSWKCLYRSNCGIFERFFNGERSKSKGWVDWFFICDWIDITTWDLLIAKSFYFSKMWSSFLQLMVFWRKSKIRRKLISFALQQFWRLNELRMFRCGKLTSKSACKPISKWKIMKKF